MKGRFYKPSGYLSPKLDFKLPLLKENDLEIKYIWDSSIPESWHNISKKKNIKIIRIAKKKKIQMKFFEESQKHYDYLNSLVEDPEVEQVRSPTLNKVSSSNSIFTRPEASSLVVVKKVSPSNELFTRPEASNLIAVKKTFRNKIELFRNLKAHGKNSESIKLKNKKFCDKEKSNPCLFMRGSRRELFNQRFSDIC